MILVHGQRELVGIWSPATILLLASSIHDASSLTIDTSTIRTHPSSFASNTYQNTAFSQGT